MLFFKAWGYLKILEIFRQNHRGKYPPGGIVLRIITSYKKSNIIKNLLATARFEPPNTYIVIEFNKYISGNMQKDIIWG